MRELLFRAYITRTIYVEEDGYVDAEKEVRFHPDGVAIYTDGHIGISWDDFYHSLHSQGFLTTKLKRLLMHMMTTGMSGHGSCLMQLLNIQARLILLAIKYLMVIWSGTQEHTGQVILSLHRMIWFL